MSANNDNQASDNSVFNLGGDTAQNQPLPNEPVALSPDQMTMFGPFEPQKAAEEVSHIFF